MAHRNKQKTFFFSSIIFFLLGCIQTPVAIVSPTQTSIVLETSMPNRSPTSTFTPQPQVAQEDTGYEGYYTGIVVITEYYTLLSNKLGEEAYNRLSLSEQNKISLTEFIQLNEELVYEIVTIKPFIVWQIEQGVSILVADKEDQISFFVELWVWDDNAKADKNLLTLLLTLTKQEENWKINTFSENITNVLESVSTPALNIGFVPNRSYYDSIITIAQYYLLNNYSLYEKAYGLLSPVRPYALNLEEYIDYYSYYIREIESIEAIEILSLRPFYEGDLQFEYITTPDPEIRKKFVVMLHYVKGGNPASEESIIQSRFITTVFENKKWSIYSINTSP